ncbi:MAG: hypothetical protein H0U10_12440, partial [Chloroflexia bacterium]|nr:hypothetical protein [Chloroflexia bacterium]
MPGLSDLITQSNRRPGGQGANADQTRPIRTIREDAGQSPRLSDEERREILRRYRERPPTHDQTGVAGMGYGRSWDGDDGYGPYPEDPNGSPDGAAPAREKLSGRTVTLGAILVIGILAVSLGAGGVFGGRGASVPDPTATPPPVVLALG